jgi:hypothetical protein
MDIPRFQRPGNEALKRAVIEGFEKTNTDGRIIQLLNDTQLPLKEGDEYRNLILKSSRFSRSMF